MELAPTVPSRRHTGLVLPLCELTETLAERRARAALYPDETSAHTTEALRQDVLTAALTVVASVVPGLGPDQLDLIAQVLEAVDG